MDLISLTEALVNVTHPKMKGQLNKEYSRLSTRTFGDPLSSAVNYPIA